MVVLRITNGFTRLSDPKLISRANAILQSMTGNSNFPTPSPTLAALQTAIDDFTAALSDAENGGNYDKAVKNQKKIVLIDVLHNLGAYVLFTASGLSDPFLAAKSSGFNVAKTASPKLLGTVDNLQLSDGVNPGELVVTYNRIVGGRAVVCQYTDDPNLGETSWHIEVGTSSKIVLSGLQRGKKYFVRIIGIGANDQKCVSEIVSRLVQ